MLYRVTYLVKSSFCGFTYELKVLRLREGRPFYDGPQVNIQGALWGLRHEEGEDDWKKVLRRLMTALAGFWYGNHAHVSKSAVRVFTKFSSGKSLQVTAQAFLAVLWIIVYRWTLKMIYFKVLQDPDRNWIVAHSIVVAEHKGMPEKNSWKSKSHICTVRIKLRTFL